MTTLDTNTLFALPDVPWAADALNLVLTEESGCVANHSVRSWVFARLLAEHLNVAHEVDDSLLFAATILHDIGLRRHPASPNVGVR